MRLPTKTTRRKSIASGQAKKSLREAAQRASESQGASKPKLANKTSAAGSNAAVIRQVTGILQSYADRAVFRGFAAGPARGGIAIYKIVWHHDRRFELRLDVPKRTMRFSVLLPGVRQGSAMHRDIEQYLKSRHSPELPPHRRVDRGKAVLQCSNRAGNISLRLTLKGSDFEYAVRKLIHVVDEIFKGFLIDGPYYEYMVEQLGLNPDQY